MACTYLHNFVFVVKLSFVDFISLCVWSDAVSQKFFVACIILTEKLLSWCQILFHFCVCFCSLIFDVRRIFAFNSFRINDFAFQCVLCFWLIFQSVHVLIELFFDILQITFFWSASFLFSHVFVFYHIKSDLSNRSMRYLQSMQPYWSLTLCQLNTHAVVFTVRSFVLKRISKQQSSFVFVSLHSWWFVMIKISNRFSVWIPAHAQEIFFVLFLRISFQISACLCLEQRSLFVICSGDRLRPWSFSDCIIDLSSEIAVDYHCRIWSAFHRSETISFSMLSWNKSNVRWRGLCKISPAEQTASFLP